MSLNNWLSGEKDEHITGGWTTRVDGIDWGKAVLSFMVNEQERIQEFAVLMATQGMLRVDFVPTQSVLCAHVMHKRCCTVTGHIFAAQEGRHSEIHTVTMHAFKSRLAKYIWASDSPQVEQGTDEVLCLIIQPRALLEWDPMEDQCFEYE